MYAYVGKVKDMSFEIHSFCRSKEALDVPIYKGGETLRGFIRRMEKRLGLTHKEVLNLSDNIFRAYVIQLEYLEVGLMDLEAL